jgi:hypothetical protein
VEDEAKVVRAGGLMFFAVHSDLHTMRRGLTFVIDTSTQPDTKVSHLAMLNLATVAATPCCPPLDCPPPLCTHTHDTARASIITHPTRLYVIIVYVII